jgi:RNA polymerase sigma-70 factor, ECF subfamily
MKHNTTDEELIGAVACRDDAAMAVLYERHKTKAYRFIRCIVNDPVLADDIVSDVFLCVWRQAGEFKCRSKLSTWILAIARNRALATTSRRARAATNLEEANEVLDPSDSPEDAAIISDQRLQLRRCILRLSLKHREIITLIYYQCRSVAEVATILGVNESTVKTRMFHARKRLREMLQNR